VRLYANDLRSLIKPHTQVRSVIFLLSSKNCLLSLSIILYTNVKYIAKKRMACWPTHHSRNRISEISHSDILYRKSSQNSS